MNVSSIEGEGWDALFVNPLNKLDPAVIVLPGEQVPSGYASVAELSASNSAWWGNPNEVGNILAVRDAVGIQVPEPSYFIGIDIPDVGPAIPNKQAAKKHNDPTPLGFPTVREIVFGLLSLSNELIGLVPTTVLTVVLLAVSIWAGAQGVSAGLDLSKATLNNFQTSVDGIKKDIRQAGADFQNNLSLPDLDFRPQAQITQGNLPAREIYPDRLGEVFSDSFGRPCVCLVDGGSGPQTAEKILTDSGKFTPGSGGISGQRLDIKKLPENLQFERLYKFCAQGKGGGK